MNAVEIEAQALGPSPADRAHLMERPVLGLDIDPSVEDEWTTEIERRYTEFEHGTVSLLPGPEALARLKSELR